MTSDELVLGELVVERSPTDAENARSHGSIAGSSLQGPWSLPDFGDDIRNAFALGTCGGCHAHDAIDGGFHVSPLRHGGAKPSPMPEEDLARRADWMRHTLCNGGAR